MLFALLFVLQVALILPQAAGAWHIGWGLTLLPLWIAVVGFVVWIAAIVIVATLEEHAKQRAYRERQARYSKDRR